MPLISEYSGSAMESVGTMKEMMKTANRAPFHRKSKKAKEYPAREATSRFTGTRMQTTSSVFKNSTNVLMYEVYMSAFRNSNMSRAGAITTILLVIIIVTVVLQFRMMNKTDE